MQLQVFLNLGVIANNEKKIRLNFWMCQFYYFYFKTKNLCKSLPQIILKIILHWFLISYPIIF